MHGRFRIGDFEYEAATGELVRVAGEGEPALRRLPPRPADLLNLLIEHDGDLVPRETIRRRIWGDVEIDFDRVLHFCVGQLRSALDDTAEESRYVENLPRRGYRLREPASPVEPGATPAADGGPSARSWIVRRGWLAALPLLALVALTLALRSSEPPRLAIGSFAPPADLEVAGDPKRIAEELLIRFGRLGDGRLGVVGPSRTAAFGTDLDAVSRMIDELEVDYVVNGRFLRNESGAGLLVELIRARDGVHVWVERYDLATETGAIADEVAAAVVEALGIGPGRTR